MKVLHLSTFDAGSGAARGSLWLHEALARRNVTSSMIVAKKIGDDDSIKALPDRFSRMAARLRMRLDDFPTRLYASTEESFWTLGLLPSRFDRVVEKAAPDIIHLHWVGAGFLPIAAMKRFSCPIVWTLRDMWSFTGGCHYTAGCERYREGCGACPQLRSNRLNDISRVVWRHKQKHWRDLDLWLVPISRWLGECASSSALLGHYPVEVIPNGLDVSTFSALDRTAARSAWNLPSNRPIAVYGAINATQDPRKGFNELIEGLRALGKEQRARDLLLLVFGDLRSGDMPDCGIETRHVGFVEDNRRLAELYASADVAVMPSLQEAFGKTLIEAMACGTPVVAFDSGGPRDIVTHCVDGYLARPFDPNDLARGILWCLDAVAAGEGIRAAAREKVLSEFDIEVVATRYHALYQRILDRSANAL
ncbi:MAG: glycosyltransferase family 4 protein [Reyranellaceae bacterium]